MPARVAPTARRQCTALAVLLVMQALALGPAEAAEPAHPPFEQESAKQEDIYRSRGEKVPGGYITTRGLSGYGQLLHSGFHAALQRLGPSDRWLDIGAGSGKAILDYYDPQYPHGHDRKRPRTLGKARAVALSIEDRRTDLWHERAAKLEADQIRYLHGKRLRDYTGAELGKFRMITDVYGGFSYTDELSLFTEKALRLLELQGSFFSMLASVRLQDGKDNPKTWYLTEILDADGRDVKVCAWLKRITCVKVSCESQSTWETPTELIHIRKVCNPVSVPALTRLQYEAGTPPGRRFQLKR